MSITKLSDGTQVIEGEHIPVFRMLALKGALKLEILGLHRRGRSAYSIIKEEFGLKGSKQSVLAQYEGLLRKVGILQ